MKKEKKKSINIGLCILGFFIPVVIITIYLILESIPVMSIIIFLLLLLSGIGSLVLFFINDKGSKERSISLGIIISLALFILIYILGWPLIQKMIVQKTCNTYGNEYKAEKVNYGHYGQSTGREEWACCPDTKTSVDECIVLIEESE